MDSVDAGRHRNMHCSQFSGRHVTFLGKLNFFIARNSYGFYFMYVSSPAGRRLTTSSLWWRKSRSESLERWQKLWRFKDLCSVVSSTRHQRRGVFDVGTYGTLQIMRAERKWNYAICKRVNPDPLEMFLLCSIQYLHWWIVWSKRAIWCSLRSIYIARKKRNLQVHCSSAFRSLYSVDLVSSKFFDSVNNLKRCSFFPFFAHKTTSHTRVLIKVFYSRLKVSARGRLKVTAYCVLSTTRCLHSVETFQR